MLPTVVVSMYFEQFYLGCLAHASSVAPDSFDK
jgi:hypothetical protein